MVRVTGLEPARVAHQILSLARLPIPPHPHGVEQVTGIEPAFSAWEADVITIILHLHNKFIIHYFFPNVNYPNRYFFDNITGRNQKAYAVSADKNKHLTKYRFRFIIDIIPYQYDLRDNIMNNINRKAGKNK